MKSSIWPAIRQNLHTVKSQCCWLLGKGYRINLSKDKWLPHSLAELLSILEEALPFSKAQVKDVIIDNSWSFPDGLVESFSDIIPII